MRGRVAQAPTMVKSASLAEDFGLQYAERLFGFAAIESLPKLLIGKNKGKTKGHVFWLKTTGKGYHSMANGGVREGAILWAWIGDTASTPRENASVGFWQGRWQALSSHYGMLSEKARLIDTQQKLRDRNEEADDRRHGRTPETIEEIIDGLSRSAEWRAKWAAADRSKAFHNDPQRRAFNERIAVLRTYGPSL